MTDTTYDLGHTETLHGAADPTLLVMLIEPTDPSAPLLRSLANLARDLGVPEVEPVIPDWTQGEQNLPAGVLRIDAHRVYRLVTDLGVSTTHPASSPHWHLVGGYAGQFAADRNYYRGEYFDWRQQAFYVRDDIAAGTMSDPGAQSSAAKCIRMAPADPPALVSSADARSATIRYDGDATGADIYLASPSEAGTPAAGLLAPGDKSLLDRLRAMEARLAGAMVWRGQWTSGDDYEAGDVVYDSTGQVSHYICTADVDDSTTNPGGDQAHWRRLH
ncbi:hypothetical protein F4Y93_12775 [Candidatus Poribacteria bacterium]|nr:hypothetical protein [Candidatus Poribacteria bacterium]